MRQFATLTEVREWLKEETGRMIRQLSDQKGFNRKEKLIGEIIEYVRYHTHDPMLSVDDIADHIALSAKYVRQLFHEHYGMPLSNFILNERLGKVKELLEQTSMQITEIAEQSGFQTKSHFSPHLKSDRHDAEPIPRQQGGRADGADAADSRELCELERSAGD